MKRRTLILFVSLLVNVFGGTDEGSPSRLYYIRDGQRTVDFSDQAFQQITGTFQNKVQSDIGWHTNSIEITSDGFIKARVAAQVGRKEDSRFPYPTACMLDYFGKIKSFFRYETRSNSKEAPFYQLEMAEPELTLVENTKNSTKCEEYVRVSHSEKSLNWFWIDFSIEQDALVERGRRYVYERNGG